MNCSCLPRLAPVRRTLSVRPLAHRHKKSAVRLDYKRSRRRIPLAGLPPPPRSALSPLKKDLPTGRLDGAHLFVSVRPVALFDSSEFSGYQKDPLMGCINRGPYVLPTYASCFRARFLGSTRPTQDWPRTPPPGRVLGRHPKAVADMSK